MSQSSSQLSLELEQLEGKWYINMTNFPMWLKGNKSNPTFNYTVITKKGETLLLDEVKYQKSGKQKTITGYDKSVNEGNTQFIWRGKGLMRILKSKWQIIFWHPTDQWAIIHFEKTLFTPEGYDVISKHKHLPVSENKIDNVLHELGIAAKLTSISQN